MEYFRHLRNDDPHAAAAGFVKMAGDETDALIIAIFMRDLSAEYAITTSMRDEDHPLAKLRRLEFQTGRLPTGQALEDVLAKRPVIKKVEGERIFFYPPTFRLHSQGPPSPEWAYALCGIRAYAPTLLEAEQEALKVRAPRWLKARSPARARSSRLTGQNSPTGHGRNLARTQRLRWSTGSASTQVVTRDSRRRWRITV
jgi:hypothetical protein